jgi:cytochrome c oxidase cbb3-type subunit III
VGIASAARFTLMLLLAGASLLAIGLDQLQQAAAGRTPPGRKPFITNCSGCHGLDATGGDRAPGISAGSNAAKLTDQELRRTIANGIAGSGMPPFASLGNTPIAAIVSYLRDLQGKAGTSRMPGDPQRGASLFFGKGRCGECHMAAGRGGFLASDLTGYGETRTPAEIHRAITSPDRSSEGVKQAVVQTVNDNRYTGIVRTEDNFSLVLQAEDGSFVLLHKSDVAKISYSAEPLMPTNYESILTAREMDDLVSYLMALRRKSDPAASRNTARRGWEESD